MSNLPNRAVQYLRMSTEHQRYSTANQAAAIRLYAERRGLELVQTYADEGISGLRLNNRPGLQKLLQDALDPGRRFEVILIYDVSRWGRFQDPDQSAHYEFVCRQAGLQVEYCAEVFQNDGSTMSTLLKSLRRVMAAEYSRELSTKVAAAKRRSASHGFWQGGPAPYGYRRMMVDPHGAPIALLATGQRKGFQGYRVTLVRGPEEEQRIVRRIFRWYADDRLSWREISRRLNSLGVAARDGARWTDIKVRSILTGHHYAGDLVYGRTRCVLGEKTQATADSWTTADGRVPAIVDRPVFGRAQARLGLRSEHLSDRELLAQLRAFMKRNPDFTYRQLRRSNGLPSYKVFTRRFGGLEEAYRRIGHVRVKPRPPLKPAAFDPDLERILEAEDDGSLNMLEVARRLRALGHTATADTVRAHIWAWRARTGSPLRRRPHIASTDAQLLDGLRRILAEKGKITYELVDHDPRLPCPAVFRRRFGSLPQAYDRIGYIQPHFRPARRAGGGSPHPDRS